MNKPVPVSIITITYNAEAYLERTIQSIAAQQRVRLGIDYDYLIIDGASTDGTRAIIQQQAQYISHWQSEPDRGLYDAMNKGMHRATGEYIWFMNAGDELHDPQVLTQLVTYLRTPSSDGSTDAGLADVYYSDALFVRNDGSPIGLRSRVTAHSLPTTLNWTDMALGMKVSHQAFVVRRELAPDYPITNLSADLDWEIRCLKAARRVDFLPFVLCRYLVGGLSRQQHRRSLIDRFRVLRTHFGLLPTLWNHVRITGRAISRRLGFA